MKDKKDDNLKDTIASIMSKPNTYFLARAKETFTINKTRVVNGKIYKCKTFSTSDLSYDLIYLYKSGEFIAVIELSQIQPIKELKPRSAEKWLR